jgi:thiol:disulfide interchange protein
LLEPERFTSHEGRSCSSVAAVAPHNPSKKAINAYTTIMPAKYIETMEEFEALMEASKTKLVIIDFTASWCDL